MRIAIVMIALSISACCHAQPADQPEPATDPPQVPLCMIGDSITWAGEGDTWRRNLIELIPTLAFVGTHTAKFGYSHAGEGGNSTPAIIARLDDIPDCANYHLMVGINDSAGATAAEEVERVSARTAGRIIEIVQGLLTKPSCERVFLASILPGWQEAKPFRDVAGSRTNELLRVELEGGALDDERIIWVEYEHRIRPMEGWQPLMNIHPSIEGYGIIAGITAEAIREALELPEEIAPPVPAPGAGVRIDNLWDAEAGQTTVPIIAGWYTLSFDVEEVEGDAAALVLHSVEDVKKPMEQRLEIAADDAGKRVTRNFFSGYEGYQYTRSTLRMELEGARISRVLLEKTRPGGEASVYRVGSYIDATTPPAPGELIECPEEE